jgi:hypothetical protein
MMELEAVLVVVAITSIALLTINIPVTVLGCHCLDMPEIGNTAKALQIVTNSYYMECYEWSLPETSTVIS